MKLTYGSGQTLIDIDEREDFIPFWATTYGEMNRLEQENITSAVRFFARKKVLLEDILTLHFVKTLHRKMFDKVWRWAGRFRKRDTNLGVDKMQVEMSLYVLLGDVRYWIENKVFPVDEMVIRCKHRMVAIHPFPNGNGRHSRLFADMLVQGLDGEVFTWGASMKAARQPYLSALREADKGFYAPLLTFARS